MKKYQVEQVRESSSRLTAWDRRRAAMNNTLEYKGYVAEIGIEDGTLFGVVRGIPDSISFEAPDAAALQNAFAEAMEDYFAHCKKMNRDPSRPFSGKFQVRIPEELHRDVFVAARCSNAPSINAWVIDALAKQVKTQQG